MGRKDNKEPKTISVPDVTNVTNVTIILWCVPKLEDLTVSTLYLASYDCDRLLMFKEDLFLNPLTPFLQSSLPSSFPPKNPSLLQSWIFEKIAQKCPCTKTIPLVNLFTLICMEFILIYPTGLYWYLRRIPFLTLGLGFALILTIQTRILSIWNGFLQLVCSQNMKLISSCADECPCSSSVHAWGGCLSPTSRNFRRTCLQSHFQTSTPTPSKSFAFYPKSA